MAEILKVTTQWTGFVGAPGYSNFFFKVPDPGANWDAGATAAADAVYNFFNATKAYFPNQVTFKVQADVPRIEDTTGEMVGIANGGTKLAIQGTGGAAAYSAASGAVITWRTDGVKRGRRVRGRTFLVPTTTAIYDIDGSLNSTGTGVLLTAANALLSAATGEIDFGVWARPSASGATDGGFFGAVSASIPDKVAVLRSRRD